MTDPSLILIFKYASGFNGFEAFGGIEALAELANDKLFFFREHGQWLGSAKELRACLFFEERRWRHFGYSPDGAELNAIVQLFGRIQSLIQLGELAPNNDVEAKVHGSPPIQVDGEPARLLGWDQSVGLVLTIALDHSGEVVERKIPPAVISPEDRRLVTQVGWLFGGHNRVEG